MTQYLDQRQSAMRSFVETCENQYGMTSQEFVEYYKNLESHGTEEEYHWWVCLSFLGNR